MQTAGECRSHAVRASGWLPGSCALHLTTCCSAHPHATDHFLPYGPPAAGTPTYMSPEMISEGRLSPEVDIFSAGVLLHEMLTGQQAWHGLR